MQIHLYGATIEVLGLIPHWIADSPADEPFVDIVKRDYVGGWFSFRGGKLDTNNGAYRFPGDPVNLPLAAIVRLEANEVIFAYESAFFAVVTLTPEAHALVRAAKGLPHDLKWDMARLD